MAYFLWDDAGMMQLVKRHQASLESSFVALPKPVERADVFRILVTNAIGGVVCFSKNDIFYLEDER